MFKINSRPLSDLNRLSRIQSFTLDEINWDHAIDHGKLWAPESMAPAFYLPSFSRLSEQARLRYNQYFALGICEQFIWFERDLICPILSFMESRQRPGDFQDALRHFHGEEVKHTEMFKRVLVKASPHWYGDRDFHFFSSNGLQSGLLNVMKRLPMVFIGWIWMAILFEERTLDYSRQYALASKSGSIDGLFASVHRFHMTDEVRHHQMDQYFLREFYDGRAVWKRKLGAFMLDQVVKSYVSPRRTSRRIFEQLSAEFVEEKGIFQDLSGELSGLKECVAFQKMAFSSKSLGRSMAWLAKYDEMDGVWARFIAEKKENFSMHDGRFSNDDGDRREVCPGDGSPEEEIPKATGFVP